MMLLRRRSAPPVPLPLSLLLLLARLLLLLLLLLLAAMGVAAASFSLRPAAGPPTLLPESRRFCLMLSACDVVGMRHVHPDCSDRTNE